MNNNQATLPLLFSNNPLLCQHEDCLQQAQLQWVAGGYREVLVAVRDHVYLGHPLLTHPLCGSIKPNQTPYRSVLVGAVAAAVSMDDCQIIADAIATYDRFAVKSAAFSAEMLQDLQQIDRYLVANMLAESFAKGASP